MLLLSHRGDRTELPGNTLAAFESAKRSGVDGFETDVRVCADGSVILFHDRVAPNGKLVSTITRADLAEVVGYPIPTLEAALSTYANSFWNLELKSAAALTPMLEILAKLKPCGPILITSFLHPIMVECSERCDYDCGIIIAHRPIAVSNILRSPQLASKIHTLVVDFETADARLVEETVTAGLRLFVYGPITADDHRLAVQLNVAGVITDRLELARSTLNRG
ncbi:hypothetical protein BH18ACI4_BH18ACI4_26810 [soil metagenome]